MGWGPSSGMAMGWYERAVSMDGRLEGKARGDRVLVLVASVLLLLLPVCFSSITGRFPPIIIAFTTFTCVPNAVILFLLVTCRPLTPAVMKGYLLMMTLSVIVIDLHQRILMFPPMWPFVVLIADASLLLRLGSRFATLLMAAMSVWIILVDAESIFRFGLYDLPGTAPQWHREKRLQENCDCDTPPCDTRMYVGGIDLTASLFVLLMDFIATRGFAESAEKEKAAMARTIETVEAIAQLLAGYDVDTVGGMLLEEEAEGRLPAAIHDALRRLEYNLRAYRPYLPKSCLPAHEQDDVDEVFSGSGETPSCDSSGPDSSQIVPSSSEIAPVSMARLGALKTARSTLLVVNTCNALPCLEQDPGTFASFFEVLLAKTMHAVELRHGLVDVFVGDRILASFNTSRTCVMHAAAAAGAAQHIVQAVRTDEFQDRVTDSTLRVDIGAASGRVLCGDMGCADMRRFSLVGPLAVMACGMERAARALGLGVVCNTALQRNAMHEQIFLLVPRLVRLAKQRARGDGSLRTVPGTAENGVDGSSRVYELLLQDGYGTQSQLGEWMYHAGVGGTQWDVYNSAMRAYLSGSTAQMAADMAGEHHVQAHTALRLLGDTTPLVVCV